MSQQRYDPCSKWMLEQRGAALLWVAGVRKVVSCRTTQPEVVHPRQLPDGLLEVTIADRASPALVLVEVATYPETRVVAQMCDDLRLARQARGVLPDAVVLCLCRKGRHRIPQSATHHSELGLSSESFSWKVVNLWEVPAETLLEAPDVGAVPWATLGSFAGPPEQLLQRCRDRIDREGGDQRESLLAVSQVFATLQFNKPELLSILGEMKMFTDIPLIKKIVTDTKVETMAESIVAFLKSRFGPPGDSIEAGLKQVKKTDRLEVLTQAAATCSDLAAFQAVLLAELSQAPAPSTRGKRRGKRPAE